MTKKSVREEMLAEASRLTTGDRNRQYGDPMVNLGDTARLVNAYLASRLRGTPVNLNEEDIAHIMVLVKIARTMSGGVKEDTYVDAAAYAAIAGEMAVRRQEENDASPMKRKAPAKRKARVTVRPAQPEDGGQSAMFGSAGEGEAREAPVFASRRG